MTAQPHMHSDDPLPTEARRDSGQEKKMPRTTGVAILLAVIAVYWPIYHGGFIYDDVTDFVQNTWLTHGDAWKHYIFRDFHNWTHYFRPLVVAMFTAQVRLFDVQPGPMHLVSLALHLANILLVGAIAQHCNKVSGRKGRTARLVGIVVMLLYGFHPALIEPLAWIGCQFDLTATFFMLAGLLCACHIKGAIARPVAVATCFFLAACSKESAIAFPLMLLVFDWALHIQRRHDSPVFSTFLKRNLPTYAAVFIAGIAYLAFRHWALGPASIPPSSHELSGFGRFQIVCFTYLRYWAMVFFPTWGMSPLHPFEESFFEQATSALLVSDIVATGLVIASFYFAARRRSALACCILAMTVALFPVLRILPTGFDPNLYHERYVMTGLAFTLSMLPLIQPARSWRLITARPIVGIGLAAMGVLWLTTSIATIRSTLPLWGNEIALWRWAITMNPNSIIGKDLLLSTYLDEGMYAEARELITAIDKAGTPCTRCTLNAAILALVENSPEKARPLLEKGRDSEEIVADKGMFGAYMLATGRMLVMTGNSEDAEPVLRVATEVTPALPDPFIWRAQALANLERFDEARAVINQMTHMLNPDERAELLERVEREFQPAHLDQREPTMPMSPPDADD